MLFLFTEAFGLFNSKVIEEGYVLALNKGNKVNTLSPAQIKDVFDEEITNWKELGGEDLPIRVFRLEDITEYYTEEELGPAYEYAGERITQLVENTPGIVAFVPQKFIVQPDAVHFIKDNTISVVRTYRNIRDIIVKMYRKYQKRNYDIDTSWRRYLLPGFRRLNVVYCLIALVWYAVIVWMTITFAVTDSKTGIPVTGGELTMYKIAVFVLLFGMTMWFGNYLNIRRKLPGMKKINVLSTILTFGYAFTISFMFLAFFAIFMAIIGYL